MSKPSREELDTALRVAGQMREQGQDPDHLAKCLLNHNYRLKMLEQLYQQVGHFLHSGQNQHEHSKLTLLMDKIRSEEIHPGLENH